MEEPLEAFLKSFERDFNKGTLTLSGSPAVLELGQEVKQTRSDLIHTYSSQTIEK